MLYSTIHCSLIFAVFSLDDSTQRVCAVISGSVRSDLVLQPAINHTGTFLLKGAEINGSSACFKNGSDTTFSLSHTQGACCPPADPSCVCDQLVIMPTTDLRGMFQIQYIPELTDVPVNLTFEYGEETFCYVLECICAYS